MTTTVTATPPIVPDLQRFMLQHRFAMEEVETKLRIMAAEFEHLHDRTPIDHVVSRLKSPQSLREKMVAKGVAPGGCTQAQVAAAVQDVAGVRVVTPFVADVYRVFDLLTAQVDIDVLQVKDYVANPKANGYRSLHAIVVVPVFLSEGAVPVTVEVQVRTKAMDFWASLEHRIYYKYGRNVPRDLLAGLREAAEDAARLDETMEGIDRRVRALDRST